MLVFSLQWYICVFSVVCITVAEVCCMCVCALQEDLEAENEAARATGSPADMKMDVTNLKE